MVTSIMMIKMPVISNSFSKKVCVYQTRCCLLSPAEEIIILGVKGIMHCTVFAPSLQDQWSMWVLAQKREMWLDHHIYAFVMDRIQHKFNLNSKSVGILKFYVKAAILTESKYWLGDLLQYLKWKIANPDRENTQNSLLGPISLLY